MDVISDNDDCPIFSFKVLVLENPSAPQIGYLRIFKTEPRGH